MVSTVLTFASFEQESYPSAWANEFEPPPHATEYHESHFDSHQKLRINGYLLFYHTGSGRFKVAPWTMEDAGLDAPSLWGAVMTITVYIICRIE